MSDISDPKRLPITLPSRHPSVDIAREERAFSPAAERNRTPIAEAIQPLIEALSDHDPLKPLSLLEVASGTGQHAAYLASRFSNLSVQPTDRSLEARESVSSWAHESNVSDRVAPLKLLDVTRAEHWPQTRYPLIYCANMIHIAPWSATEGLFSGVSTSLTSGGALILYGPYRFDGQPLAPSNIAFDERLRARDPRWGIREVSALDALASRARLSRTDTIALPANNHLLVYQSSR